MTSPWSALAIASVAFALMLAGAALGSGLRRRLQAHHLDEQTRDVVRLGSALIATITALLLGLLISAAHANYEAQRGEVREVAAHVILLDALLEGWGPDARPSRLHLRAGMDSLIRQTWAAQHTGNAGEDFHHKGVIADAYREIMALHPGTESQRDLKPQILATAMDAAKARLRLYERAHVRLPPLLIGAVLFWLFAIFVTFSLFSRLNLLSGSALLVFAFSAAVAVFILLELSDPFTGAMRLPDTALRTALPPL